MFSPCCAVFTKNFHYNRIQNQFLNIGVIVDLVEATESQPYKQLCQKNDKENQ